MSYSRYLFIVAGIVSCVSYIKPLWAAGGGYDGLIAPAAPESSGSPDGAPSGYEGLLAPLSPAPTVPSSSSGYSGVLAGQGDETPLPSTSMPGYKPLGPAKSPEDIELLSVLNKHDRNGDGVPDSVRAPRKVLGEDALLDSEGQSDMESMVERNIAQVMPTVTDTKIPAAARVENARQAYKNLGEMAEGLRSKKEIPERIYHQMGLSDAYIQKERASIDNALTMLDRALSDLKRYQ